MKKTKKVEPALFYANADKLKRAKQLVTSKEYKKVKDAYEALGGVFQEGYGVEEV